jgi:hypothetical protein
MCAKTAENGYKKTSVKFFLMGENNLLWGFTLPVNPMVHSCKEYNTKPHQVITKCGGVIVQRI